MRSMEKYDNFRLTITLIDGQVVSDELRLPVNFPVGEEWVTTIHGKERTIRIVSLERHPASGKPFGRAEEIDRRLPGPPSAETSAD